MTIKSPYPSIPRIPDTNVYNIMLRPEWPDFTIYIDGLTGKRQQYKAFVARVKDSMTALSSPLVEGGLGIDGSLGTMAGILSENVMDYPVLVHSLLALTVPFALISAYSTPFELLHALTLSKTSHLFVHSRILPRVLPVARKLGLSPKRIFILGGHASGHKSLSSAIDDIRKHKSLQPAKIQPAMRDTLAYLIFSSGTSGLSKAVMISHGNLICSIFQVGLVTQLVSELAQPPVKDGVPCHLAFLPLHHSYGLHAYCFRSCVSPTTFVMLPHWNVDLALKLIPRYKITYLNVIPSVAHQLVHDPSTREANLSSIKVISNGAAYLPPQLASKLKKLVPAEVFMTEGYGMSEATIAAIVRPSPGVLGMQSVPTSTGVLFPDLECRLLRDDGSEAAVGEVGEVWLKGGNVALGYWQNPQATRETFVDGWLRTGDKFKVDKNGYFYFADRVKDTLKISGIQVSPVEIENVLLDHPRKLILDVTVAGVSGGRTSDERIPRAWIVLSAQGKKLGATTVIKELETWHREHLSKYKWLRGGIEIVKEIPKSPTGKTLRRVLQDRYERRVSRKDESRL